MFKTLTIPGVKQYDGVLDDLAAGHDATEALVWHLEAIVEAREATPELADIGALWSFLDGLEMRVDAARSHAEKLRQALSELDSMRLDSAARAGRDDA